MVSASTQRWHNWMIRTEMKLAQSCPTLCDPMDYTVLGILQARILEWVAFPISRYRTQVSCIAGRFFTSWATRKAQEYCSGYPVPSPLDLPDSGIEPGSPSWQADSLLTELSGKPSQSSIMYLNHGGDTHYLCQMLLIRRKSQIPCTYQGTNTGRQKLWGTTSESVHHRPHTLYFKMSSR